MKIGHLIVTKKVRSEMKKIILLAVLILMGFSFQAKAQDYYDRGYDNSYNYNGYDNDGFGYFYSSLSPYGSWIEFGDGVYGWKPFHMRNIWAPYSDGQWIWTSDGWYWDSYEPFGYIVYHYGRWYYDDFYGWVWIPDYQWAPAWVEWRYDNDYIGWAPLPPYAIFSISVGIQFTHVYTLPYAHWHFVKYHYFCDPYVGKYFIGDQYKYRIYSHTKYRHDYGWRDGRVVNRGVDVNVIRKRGGGDIRERNIRTVSNIRDINDKNRVTDNEIRTFIPGKDNFRGSRVKDVKIERTGRKTSLETSKLEFGRTNMERKETTNRKTNTNTREINKEKPVIRNEKNSTGRNTTGGNINRNNTEQKRVPPRTETGKTERKQIEKPVERKQERKDSKQEQLFSDLTRRTISPTTIEKKQQTEMRKNNSSGINNRIESRTENTQIQKRDGNNTNVRTNNVQIQKRNENTGSNRTSNTQIQKRTGSNTKISRENSGNVGVQRQENRGNVRSQRK